ncbi:hypothetical protein BOTBODRAFT_47893 [Botryobasidium botryosum FD-172 SS1]|uniref:Uncharacterized protein n=1 Tax=Botryobasidium botryosum (strain FD-172 SS1) TaxID=930990 RepID=A0A067M2J6_BOTB1|nr:hypothetical protein BOTBODRAFT_47893 [Botryobasidium botryosum FD-172 SS1]
MNSVAALLDAIPGWGRTSEENLEWRSARQNRLKTAELTEAKQKMSPRLHVYWFWVESADQQASAPVMPRCLGTGKKHAFAGGEEQTEYSRLGVTARSRRVARQPGMRKGGDNLARRQTRDLRSGVDDAPENRPKRAEDANLRVSRPSKTPLNSVQALRSREISRKILGEMVKRAELRMPKASGRMRCKLKRVARAVHTEECRGIWCSAYSAHAQFALSGAFLQVSATLWTVLVGVRHLRAGATQRPSEGDPHRRQHGGEKRKKTC